MHFRCQFSRAVAYVSAVSSAASCFSTKTALAAEELNLERAMQLAEKHSPTARIASASREEAESRTLQTIGSLGPRVDLDASRVWFDKSTNKLVGVSPQLPEKTTTAGITISQPIISLAPLLMQVQAQSKLSEVARKQEKQANFSARIEGANAYLNIIKSQQLLDVANSSLAAVEQQNKDADAQSRVGRLARSDAMRFELSLTDARLQQTLAQNTLQIARSAATEILGISDTDLTVTNLTKSVWEEKKPELPKLEEALQEAKNNRIEIQNAKDQLEVAELTRTAAKSDFFPTLNAFLKYQRNFEAEDTTYGGEAYAKKDIRDTMTYGLQLNWNIWDWGSKYNRISEYSAGVIKAQAAKDASETQVTLDITQALLNLKSTVESLESAKAAVQLAEEVFRLTELRFKGGQASTSDMIQVERDQTRARGNLVTSRADVDLAWLKYLQAMGRKPTVANL